jgi:hypothetical protein
MPTPRHEVPTPIIVWQRGETVCTTLKFASDDLEVTITVDGAIIERQRFTDFEAAAIFSFEQTRRA